MEREKGKYPAVGGWLLRHFHRWWGGVGCRVSFFMAGALLVVTALVGAYLFWEQRNTLDAELRGRALQLAEELSAFTADDIVTADTRALERKLAAHIPRGGNSPDSELLFLMAYSRAGALLAATSAPAITLGGASPRHTSSPVSGPTFDDIGLDASARGSTSPLISLRYPGVYDLVLPVAVKGKTAGYIRVGVSTAPLAKKFSEMAKRAAVILAAVLFVALAVSQVIAIGITKPILRINEAVEQLGRQNWDAMLPVRGKDEISRLTHAFNNMLLALRQREGSLSNWNRDLFILHTAGLNLMESLDLDVLAQRIAGRAEDLVRADTTSLVVADQATGMLRPLEVRGARARSLQDLEYHPLESGGIYNWIASYGTPILITDTQADFRMDREVMSALGIRCLMAVPLWSSNTMRGILTVYNKKGGACFDKHDLRLFTVFANLAGAALQNAFLYTDLKKNIEELRNTQEQLVHSSKMAAIGELAANVAHEINNPLTGVLGYTSHLMKTAALSEDTRRILTMMEQETLRVRKIIRNLLDFARQKPSKLEPADLVAPLKESLALLAGMAEAAAVRITESYPAVPVMVNMDHNEIKQVFINILYNALQSMPRGGNLGVRLMSGENRDAWVDIEDTGIGIPPEHMDKIFEPFFSTKDSGQGTGLGLSISYRIVRNHGGKITVESAVGKGTLFRVSLPLHERAGVPQATVGAQGEDVR